MTIGNDMANKIMGTYDINWDKLVSDCGSHNFIDIKKAIEKEYPYLHLEDDALVKIMEDAGLWIVIGLDGSYC